MLTKKKPKNKYASVKKGATAHQPFNWKRFTQFSVCCLFASGLLWGYMELTDPDLFPVNKVAITGEYSRINQKELKQAVLPSAMKGFFAFSVKTIQQQVDSVAWVEQSTIYRRWPDELVIEIKQHKPIAVWNDVAVINDSKHVFYPPSATLPKDLPKLYGPKNLLHEVQKGYDDMNAILKTINLSINEISMDQRYSWRVQLNNGIYLIIGHMDYQHSLHNFVKAYKKIIADRASEVNYVDLRYNNGMAVHWKNAYNLALLGNNPVREGQ